MAGIHTHELDVVISGVTTLTAEGTAEHHVVSVNGVSTYLAADLESRIAKITGDGVMNVVLNVKDELFGLAEELETYSGAVRLGSVQPCPPRQGTGS